MNRIKLAIAFFLVFQASGMHAQIPDTNLVKYVKPIIGTQRMGHTFPGVSAPFGMVQLSPDTDTIPYELDGKYNPDVYKYCAGYQYDDPTIVGFSHTHFSGTGHSDLGDFLVMPTSGRLQLNPGTANDPASGFRSGFKHENETAEAGYYRVKLDDDNIIAELTATTRVGVHRYHFPPSSEAHIILDLMHGIYNYADKNVWTYVRVVNDTLITGYRQTNGWARTRTVYFAMSFSRPFSSYGMQDFSRKEVYRGFWRKFDQSNGFPELAGRQLRMHFDFATDATQDVLIKFALSPVSMSGALLNMQQEAPGWNFDGMRAAAQENWNRELQKLAIRSNDVALKQNFYTSVYHAFLMPNTYMDVNGLYRGLDQEVHQANGFTNYTSFSLWDTYRALHPLLNLVQSPRNADIAQSMLMHYEQSSLHMLPVWSHYANENWCMIGYHSVPVIADVILYGRPAFDVNAALDACVQTARNRWYDGLGYYIDKGYVPEDKSGASVSKTLEYAFDDWCIAQVARKLNRMDIFAEFSKRADNFRNVYDASSGYMRPRLSDGTFRKEFDVLSTHNQGYIEGNAWNYSLYVPQDPARMISLMGGEKKFIPHLDSLFTMHLPDEFFKETEDITRDGIIGNYVHGNEPSHHVAYLYNWTKQPWKTQERIRMILPNQYRPAPDGLGGNDDCGQMSAWYIFSALGFYPVAPASGEYALGSPAVDGASIKLANGTLDIEVVNQGPNNIYVQQVELNGKLIKGNFIRFEDIKNGGKLVFRMSNRHR